MITVLIADDQTLVRDGFRMILDEQEDMVVSARPGWDRGGRENAESCDRTSS